MAATDCRRISDRERAIATKCGREMINRGASPTGAIIDREGGGELMTKPKTQEAKLAELRDELIDELQSNGPDLERGGASYETIMKLIDELQRRFRRARHHSG